MAVIFIGSTDLLASHRTSRFLGPFLRWIYPGISDQAIQHAQYVIRKGGHLTVYAILAVLCQRALQLGSNSWPSLDPRSIWAAFALATLYAISDELHQSFVATRLGSGFDVLIDAVGAALGLACVWAWATWRTARPRPAPAIAHRRA